MVGVTTYRWTFEERHGAGPWVMAGSDVMTEREAEVIMLALRGIVKGCHERRISPLQILRWAALLLDLDLDSYFEQPLSHRMAALVARGSGAYNSAGRQ